MTLRSFLFLAVLLLVIPAYPRDFSNAEKQALQALVERYEPAIVEQNFAVQGAAIPPRLLERYVAARGSPDLERDLWVYLFVSDSEEITRQIGTTTETFKLDLDNARFCKHPTERLMQ